MPDDVKTLRDEIAITLLKKGVYVPLNICTGQESINEYIAESCYALADAMIKERNKNASNCNG